MIKTIFEGSFIFTLFSFVISGCPWQVDILRIVILIASGIGMVCFGVEKKKARCYNVRECKKETSYVKTQNNIRESLNVVCEKRGA